MFGAIAVVAGVLLAALLAGYLVWLGRACQSRVGGASLVLAGWPRVDVIVASIAPQPTNEQPN
jgi:hypothetical protein